MSLPRPNVGVAMYGMAADAKAVGEVGVAGPEAAVQDGCEGALSPVRPARL